MDHLVRPQVTLETLNFDNSYARLPGAFHAKLAPTALSDPYLVSFNKRAAELLELDPTQSQRPEFLAYFSGQKILPGAEPLAMLYAGHQFGHYVPQLGDGRAILLGEVVNSCGNPMKRMPSVRHGWIASIQNIYCATIWLRLQ